jgi:hypothetical protein
MFSATSELLNFFLQGDDHEVRAGGCDEAMSAICPNQLHDALVAFSAVQQVVWICPAFLYSFREFTYTFM